MLFHSSSDVLAFAFIRFAFVWFILFILSCDVFFVWHWYEGIAGNADISKPLSTVTDSSTTSIDQQGVVITKLAKYDVGRVLIDVWRKPVQDL